MLGDRVCVPPVVLGDAGSEQMKAGSHDWIVMSSRGRGDVRSLVLGSVHQALNASPTPVLIVHGDTGETRPPEP